jgi:CRP-like cAMP-binding protein
MNRLLIASTDRFGPIRPSTRRGLERCSQSIVKSAPGEAVVRRGQRCRLTVLASGIALHSVALQGGERQIVGVAVPGDVVDLEGLFGGIEHEIEALSECTVRQTTLDECQSLIASHPDLLAALSRAAQVRSSRQQSWLVSLGRRSATARAAHLFCEVYARLQSVGLVDQSRCEFPAYQADIADALGLSIVHTHRVLVSLLKAGLACLQNGVLTVADFDRLAEAADYEPGRGLPRPSPGLPPPISLFA